jgi:hypothetical protein
VWTGATDPKEKRPVIMMIGADKQETDPMTDSGGLDFLYTRMSGME